MDKITFTTRKTLVTRVVTCGVGRKWLIRGCLHVSSVCLSDTEPTYRHNPPVPQTKGRIAQLEAQETKHSEELRSGGTDNNNEQQSPALT